MEVFYFPIRKITAFSKKPKKYKKRKSSTHNKKTKE
jgi:hypothetical protein